MSEHTATVECAHDEMVQLERIIPNPRNRPSIRPNRGTGFESMCPVCHVQFYQRLSDHKMWCSKKCADIGRQKNPRYLVMCLTCGKPFEAIRKLHSNNRNVYCSLKCRNIGYHQYVAEKNPNWKGGKKQERSWVKYKEWRDAVFQRDDYRCRRCFLKGVELNAHHVKPWATNEDDRFNVDNGLTLCFDCHMVEHGRNFRVDLCQN